MNYIKQLQVRVKELEKQIEEKNEKAIEIITYLNLPKFYDDPTVQKNDIITRVMEIWSV